jgi:signal transduction histidine kinase/CheY-like chemotaxis protein
VSSVTTLREEQFLILSPTGRDAGLTSDLLRRANRQATVCRDMDELCRRACEEGVMALLLAEEALTTRALSALRELLAGQPSWSDLPILLFTGPLSAITRALSPRAIAELGNVTLLERPLRPVTMLSAANAALRARKRQYMARDELKAQREQVRQRDQFLAMLGHELRNPLSAICMAIALEDEGDAAAYKAIVSRQARHLTRLVDDLLDVSRVTSGKVALQRAPLDLNELTRRALANVSGSLAQAGLSFRAELPDQPVLIEGDAVRLEQILMNLLNNAIKYTSAGGRIELHLSTRPDEVELSVRDDGVGIAPEMLPRVFDLFAQAEGTLDRAKGGMGIGLTLVQNLVHLHGGKVSAESEGIGRGSTFVVRLPRNPLLALKPSEPPPAKRPKNCSRDVLIIEDNDDSRELMASMLRRRSHKVFAAADGPTGVELALGQHPSAILVDIGLPGLDGYAVARTLRPQLGRDVLMIAITGYGQPEDKRRALEAGFDEHLTKPVDLFRLELLLERAPS